MTDAISTTQSALSAMSTSMAATANNVANLDTDGYKSKDVRLATGPQALGVRVSGLAEDTSPGGLRPETVTEQNEDGVNETRLSMVETSNVDLTRQLANMTAASQNFEANVVVLRTSDEMAGTLLDLRA